MDGFRWFADESVLGFGKLLARQRQDVLYPGHPLLPSVPLGALDIEWMPVVAALDLVAFHRDRKIRTRPLEVLQYREHGLRSIWFGGKRDLSSADQVSLALRHWAKIEEAVHAQGAGPWSLTLTSHGVRDLPWRPLP